MKKNSGICENEVLLNEIRRVHEESHGVYGSRKICWKLNETSAAPVNHKRVERIMRENGIRSKTRRKYKATTNSRHNLPVAENILNRDFTANAPGQKMVSDITYIPTDEGWLYLAGVMDLRGKKQKQPNLNIPLYFITVSGYTRLMDIRHRRHTTGHIKMIRKIEQNYGSDSYP